MRKTLSVLWIAMLVAGLAWSGCGKEPTSVTAPTVAPGQAAKPIPAAAGIEEVMAIQERHTSDLMAIPNVVGTATGLGPEGKPAVTVFVKVPDIKGIPSSLDGVPVVVKVTGEIRALEGRPAGRGKINARKRFDRPVPIGVSSGNISVCSVGTIGCRAKDADGNVYALSNNHVYALENSPPDSEVVQPGRIDAMCFINFGDVIGKLHDCEPIRFLADDSLSTNSIDAAIALTDASKLGNATPSDGYGMPNSDAVPAAVGQHVQKYGRTTSLTRGIVTAINATLEIIYYSGVAKFVDQIVIESRAPFAQPGDSGSLVVTDDSGCNPVGLLFAGSRASEGGVKIAIANPIGPVLTQLEVTIDGK